MPQDPIGDFLKTPVQKPKKSKPPSIEEFLSTPVAPAPPPAPAPEAPGFFENLKIGGQRALLSAADAGRVMEEALGAASRGDFKPLGQVIELAGRGVAPIVSALASRPEQAAGAFAVEQMTQAPRVGEITAEREARMDTQPELYSREARAERARLDAAAGRDPSLAGKITRRATEGVLSAIPAIVTGATTGGSVPAVAAMAGLQSMNAPEMLIPNIALAATPIPVAKAIAPIVRRIKAARSGSLPAAVETPAIRAETVLPGVEAPPALPVATPAPAAVEAPLNASSTPAERFALTAAQREAVALNSAIRKLGTDSADEISEMIANSNRRFNKTVSGPGKPKREITPAERQSAVEDFEKVNSLTKEENAALAEVLPERAFEPVQAKGKTSRNISDIPNDEAMAQLDANLRELKTFFGSRDIARENVITQAVGKDAADPAIVSTADLGLDVAPVPVRPADAVPVARRISLDDISLGRDTLSKGRMFSAQENLKGGVRPETKGVKLRDQIEPITVAPDPARPGKFIVEDDGNHRVALMKLQGVKEEIPVKSFETAAQTDSIRAAVGPRAGEIAPMEAAVQKELDALTRPRAAEPPAPVSIDEYLAAPPLESMEGAARRPIFDPQRNMAPLEVASMKGAAQPQLMETAPKGFKPALKKALNLAGDIYQISHSLMSSGDISFILRQGAILNLPPSRWGIAGKTLVKMFEALIPDRPTSIKGGIKAQFKSQTERFARMSEAVAADPDAVTGANAGLKLASQSGGFRKADGEFASKIADHIPIVRESQQAYTMAADHTRLNTFKLYKAAIDKQDFTADQVKRGYQAAARWINIASGRGSFGEKMDKALDALSFFGWSPRFLASRIQVLNPLTYLRNAGTAEGRVVLKHQMSEMAQFTAMIGGTLLLAKAAGFKVGTDPDRPDFLRLSIGNYSYDGLAGLQPIMRLVYQVGKDAIRAGKGEPPEEGKTALDVGARFLRGKAAPVPSFFIDYFDRKTFEGKPFNLTDAAVDRIMPLMWGDMIEAYQREGLGGPLMLAPGGTGLGASYYEPKPIDAAIEQRPALLNELVRLQVKIKDPRRKPEETDDAYKGRQEAIANLYTRYGSTLMADRDYANLPEADKQKVFDLLHSRISDAVNTRDRRTFQFQPSMLINSLRRSARNKTIRARMISGRPPL